MSDENELKTAAEASPAQSPKIHWDDSEMQTHYSNVCNVMGTREEIMLLFGSNQAWQTGQTEVSVKLSNRILLTPHAAKRLKVLLEMGLKEYEARFGEVKL
ncbi:DUF3467 domain-containing protein [Nitrincola iocasae]|uniref:DUF3467 domain-containing protein n=1 Tax=Nitrincola iocasae TaxID=2614693 RepID=A0A5J6LEP4_9GAMM|nr:DUF3467 domain-containing protein [Nitrincola iocasae]QEW06792.1 DUF3467 domain-containing protein [Nitrincola iocasae]